MAHNQSYVTVMLNKRPYTNNIAVFVMVGGINQLINSDNTEEFEL